MPSDEVVEKMKEEKTTEDHPELAGPEPEEPTDEAREKAMCEDAERINKSLDVLMQTGKTFLRMRDEVQRKNRIAEIRSTRDHREKILRELIGLLKSSPEFDVNDRNHPEAIMFLSELRRCFLSILYAAMQDIGWNKSNPVDVQCCVTPSPEMPIDLRKFYDSIPIGTEPEPIAKPDSRPSDEPVEPTEPVVDPAV